MAPQHDRKPAGRDRMARKKTTLTVLDEGAVSALAPLRTFQPRPVRIVAPAPAAGPAAAAGKSVRLPGDATFRHERYRLREVLGQGGTGTVYLGEDRLLGMTVAIKVLADCFSHDPQAVEALKCEARNVMQLSHRHIVRLHTLDKCGSRYFLVMEYVRGCTLRETLVSSQSLSPASALSILAVCEDALSYAHRHGVLHNDLKPDNIMLTEDGVLKIIDFGVSCLVGTRHRHEDIMGTPAYMSPEQQRGEMLDFRTDIFALGMILYELLTGHLPFPEGLADLDILGRPHDALNGVSDPLRHVLEVALAWEREDRWETVAAFADAFRDACAQA